VSVLSKEDIIMSILLSLKLLQKPEVVITEFVRIYCEQKKMIKKVTCCFCLCISETGHDPAVHGARLEDRFYNNDSFKVHINCINLH